MAYMNRVVWKEGMFLQPQHFQQSDRFFMGEMNARLNALYPHGYGFIANNVNAEALSNGLFAFTQASGIMPDGAKFEMPGNDPVPPGRPFKDFFAPDVQSLLVYLALPLAVEGKANVLSVEQAGSSSRWRSRQANILDEVQGNVRKDIDIATLNMTVLFEGESRDGYAVLPAAKLVRNSAGVVELSASFVPPLLRIGASPWLCNEMRSLIEMLLAKSASLSQGRRQKVSGLAEFKATDETAFRLLQTINTWAPLLNHHHVAPDIHPYWLFEQLTHLCGALCTFSADVSIRQLPRYDHAALGEMLGSFGTIIRTVLGAELSAGCITIPIESAGHATFACRVPDEKLFTTAQFFFGVSARISEKELIIGTLQRLKMCSRDRLELLIPSAMPGLSLIHTARPPEGLSTKPGFQYFSLSQKGDFWEGIKTAGSIAFYFPNEFPDLKMELLALRE